MTHAISTTMPAMCAQVLVLVGWTCTLQGASRAGMRRHLVLLNWFVQLRRRTKGIDANADVDEDAVPHMRKHVIQCDTFSPGSMLTMLSNAKLPLNTSLIFTLNLHIARVHKAVPKLSCATLGHFSFTLAMVPPRSSRAGQHMEDAAKLYRSHPANLQRKEEHGSRLRWPARP